MLQYGSRSVTTKPIRACIIALLTCGYAVPLGACLWDYDTLLMERRQFPTALNLITGKFLRHSPEFYRWRIANRQERIQANADDPRLFDDLAVAYDKTGQHQLAIDTMLDKDRRFPGLYETFANLGTFYIHSGDLEEGLTWINKAIALNPNAHFGREVYQQLLVRYVLSRIKPDETQPSLPLRSKNDGSMASEDFASYVAKQHYGQSKLTEEQLAAAVKGVLGMMRFGHFDSPILLEALGDLLRRQEAKRLATRAYLKASYASKKPTVRTAYHQLAKKALRMQTPTKNSHRQLELQELESEFQTELNDAISWYAVVEADEQRWIAAGEDADLQFKNKYYQAPTISTGGSTAITQTRVRLLMIGVITCCALTIPTIWYLRKRSQRSPSIETE